VDVAVFLIILRSGLLVRARTATGWKRPRPWLAVAAVIAAASVLGFGLSLPWNIYAHWWRETQYGLSSQPFVGWLGEQLLSLPIGILGLLILLEPMYLLMRRAPRTWWIWSGGIVAAFIMFALVVSPVLVEPLFNTYRPAPPGPVREAIVQMAQANDVPSDKIYVYDGSRQSNRYTANVSGLFGTARIAMSDVMFKQGADLAEVKAVVGHEMGHYVEGHAVRYALLFGAIAILALFLIDRLQPVVLRLAGGKGVGGIEDPAGYPVIGLLFTVLAVLGAPVVNSITRVGEAQADTFSLQHVREPDGLARALVKTIEYRAATPSPLEEILFYDHPAVGSRVRKAMEWKAAHPTGR
jgi:STE24 endopeptidase